MQGSGGPAHRALRWVMLGAAVWFGATQAPAAAHFRIASYNLENYLLEATAGRPAKPPQARQAAARLLAASQADLLALQEVGGRAALAALQHDLQSLGRAFPHSEIVFGPDTNIQVAVLSRFPLVARAHRTNDVFLLQGRRARVSRGFLEVGVAVGLQYRVTVIVAHLKSRRPVAYADEAELREQEARLLRQRVDDLIRQNAKINLAVVGDLNDHPASPAVRLLLGRGNGRLTDTRPTEPGGAVEAGARRVAWTHYYAQEDSYSRIDYILISAGLAREWRREDTTIMASPHWGVSSDHRPIVAAFEARDR